MQTLQLLLTGIFIFSLCQAASSIVEEFSLEETVKEVKNAIGKPELYEKIVKLNDECATFRAIQGNVETLHEFIHAQEQIAVSFYLQESMIDFENPEILQFTCDLLESIEDRPELFNEDSLLAVFSVLVASRAIEITFRIRKVLLNHVRKLKIIPRFKFLNFMLKYASTKTCFIIPAMLNESFVSATRIKSFLDAYITAVFDQIPPEEYSNHVSLFSIFILRVTETDIILDDNSYRLIFTCFKATIVGVNQDLRVPLILSLAVIYTKIFDRSELVRLVIDIIFSEEMGRAIANSEKFIEIFMDLIRNCSKADPSYFKMMQKKSASQNYLSKYLEQLRATNMASICFDNLARLSLSSTESEYRAALSAVKNLKQIYKTLPDIVTSIPNIFNVLDVVQKTQVPLYHDYDHPFNSIVLEIAAHLGFINFDRFEPGKRYGASSNLAFSIGHLLNKSGSPYGEFPAELSGLVQEVLPILDEILDHVSEMGKYLKGSLTEIDLPAHIKFINLHHSSEVIRSCTAQIYVLFLVSNPLHQKLYLKIRDFETTDEADILVSSFLRHFEKHLSCPNEGDLKYLREYYDYLIERKYLNKSLELFIKRLI